MFWSAFADHKHKFLSIITIEDFIPSKMESLRMEISWLDADLQAQT